MAEFGQPARNATTDANAGVINPPAQKTTARTIAQPQQKQQITTLDTGVLSFGESMGEALAGQVEKREEFIEANHAMDVEIEAAWGTAAKSIEELDATTNWKSAFGGNREITTREVQQRESDNILRAKSLEIGVNIEQYAGMDTTEFKESVLKAGLNSMLEKHKGDEQSRRLLAHTWIKEAAGLANSHKKEMDAFNQIQLKESSRKRLRLIADKSLDNANRAQTPSEAADARQPVSDIFGPSVPLGHTLESWNILRGEEIGYALENGNVGMFNAAIQAGFFTGKSAEFMQSLERPARKYSEKLTKEAANLRHKADIAANDTTDVAVVREIYKQLGASLEGIEDRTIKGFGPSDINNEQQKADETERQYVNRYSPKESVINAARNKAAKAAAKEAEQNKDVLEMYNRNNNVTTGDTSWYMSAKRQNVAMDTLIMKGLQDLHGEDATKEEMLASILLDDESMDAALTYVGKGDAASNIIPNAIATVINGDHKAFIAPEDEKRFSPQAQQIVGRLRKLGQAINLEDTIGSALTAKYNLLINAVEMGSSVDRMHKDMDLIDENAQKPKPIYQPLFDNDHKAISKLEHVQNILTTRRNEGRDTGYWFGVGADTKMHPTSQDITQAGDVYATGLQISRGDAKRAGEYLSDWLANSQTPVRLGNTVHDVSNLKGLTQGANPVQHDVGDILKYASESNQLMEHIRGIRGNTETSTEPVPILDLGEIPNLEIRSVLGRDALLFNTVASPKVYPITFDNLRLWDAEMTEQANFRLQETADKELAQDAFLNRRRSRREQRNNKGSK